MSNYITLPVILLFTGGLLSLLGAVMTAINSNKQENIIAGRNDEINKLTIENKELSKKTINIITGGNSYAYYDVGARHVEGIYKEFGLALRLVGDFPLSDVTIKIMWIIESEIAVEGRASYEVNILSDENYPLLTRDLFSINRPPKLINLDGNKNPYIRITISSRNGEIAQHMRFSQKENGYYSMAMKVVKYIHVGNGAFNFETLLENKDEDYPEPIDWVM